MTEKAFVPENMPDPVKLHTPNHFQHTPGINSLTRTSIFLLRHVCMYKLRIFTKYGRLSSDHTLHSSGCQSSSTRVQTQVRF